MKKTKEEAERRAGNSSKFSPLLVCGLRNLGNTCYFNSGVQLLANCDSFLYGLWQAPESGAVGRRASVLNYTGGKNSSEYQKALAKLFVQMESKETVTPSEALDSLGKVNENFMGRSQQDCAEMLSVTVGAVEDEGRLSADLEVLLKSFEEDSARYTQLTGCPPPGMETSGKEGEPLHSTQESPPPPPEACALRDEEEVHHTEGGRLHGLLTQSDLARYKLMREVNEKNAELEKRSQDRRNVPASKRTPFSPPKLFFNSTTDGFKGYQLSEVVCHRCNATSSIVESFTTLLLDIPTHSERKAFAKQHPEIERCLPNGEPLHRKKPVLGRWYNPFSVISYLFSLLRSFFTSLGPLTLEECLDIHFEPYTISGNNAYQCESCGESTSATKKVSLLSIPENLLIQMKRFDVGVCFDSKKTDSVSFPIAWTPLSRSEVNDTERKIKNNQLSSYEQPEVLDLRYYLHPSVAEEVALPPSYFQLSRKNIPGSEEGIKQSSYSLGAVVSHIGSLGGGHYVSYVFKTTTGKSAWLHISDDEVTQSSAEEVSTVEDYVLLYNKQPIVTPKDEELTLRNRARYYLQRVDPSSNPLSQEDEWVYISREWLHRAAFFKDPGPIINYTCYCTEAQQKQLVMHRNIFPSTVRVGVDVPHVHGPPAEWMYIPIPKSDYFSFYKMFGGNLYLSEAAYQELLMKQAKYMEAYKAALAKR